MLAPILLAGLGLVLSPGALAPRHAARRGVSSVRCELTESLPPGWKEVIDSDSGKPYYYNSASGVTQWQKPAVGRFPGAEMDGDVRTLTPATSWRVKLDLTAPGAASPVTITASIRFAEEEGYEPPQGALLVESCVPENALKLGEQKARWLLSEDPEDRKDSLWIWGLFSDPLYPFLLFELELTEPLALADGVSVPAGPLYFQVDHRRKDGKVVLGEGAVTYKVSEKLAADLVGLSAVTYDEPVPCGTIRFLDTANDMSKSYI